MRVVFVAMVRRAVPVRAFVMAVRIVAVASTRGMIIVMREFARFVPFAGKEEGQASG